MNEMRFSNVKRPRQEKLFLAAGGGDGIQTATMIHSDDFRGV
jgi:hypothetical protein